MKFDRKYGTIKAPKVSDFIDETDESEPIIPEEKSTPSPRGVLKGSSRLNCPLLKGNQAPHPKFERPN